MTGTKTNILGTGDFEYAVTYYDDEYRPIEILSKYRDGNTEYTYNNYDFVGNVEVTKTERSGGNFNVPEYYWYEYDPVSYTHLTLPTIYSV